MDDTSSQTDCAKEFIKQSTYLKEKPLTPAKPTYRWEDRKCYGKSYYSHKSDAMAYCYP